LQRRNVVWFLIDFAHGRATNRIDFAHGRPTNRIDFAHGRPTNPMRIPVDPSDAWYYRPHGRFRAAGRKARHCISRRCVWSRGDRQDGSKPTCPACVSLNRIRCLTAWSAGFLPSNEPFKH